MFHKEDLNETRVTVITEAHGSTTKEELEKLVEFRASIAQGKTVSFDKLEELLVIE